MMKTGITKIEHQAPAVINTKDDRALWERKICWMMQKANAAILIKVYKYMWRLILAEEGL